MLDLTKLHVKLFFNLKRVSLKDGEKNLDPNLGSWAEKVLKGNL